MHNRFNINESEKNRIRDLHGIQLITEESDDGKITKKEYKRIQKSAYKLLKTIQRNLRRTYDGKTINLYAEEKSVGEEIQTREGELEFGQLKVRRVFYPYGETRRGLIKNLKSDSKWGPYNQDDIEGRISRVLLHVVPAMPGAPPWVKWLTRVLKKDADGYSKNLYLTIDCRENGRMWLRQEKPGADFATDESALKDTNVTNTKLMNDIKNSFCKSKELVELKRIISELSDSKLVPDADYAQVDDQEDSEEIV